ncbi:hypothetical protein LX97_01321 [Nonlabens dokdonensis]|uniref:Glycosyl hydrolase, family 16 n=2 Tax=Nonlabens dokdonensis TaxID=328515 RepID=L7W9Z1_NONDD|nr:hypothetical protein [Nonlabens dokdonensis]AGC76661.1 glycosyl hydrolase, family 16 [Nonlabens dokdonensis DSW-6]PZX44310.1 hypothetical protein LX97_01321 [Nonlabens dokdonensis]
MKNLKFLFVSILLVFVATTSCESDEDTDLGAAIEAPSGLDVIFNITQDNSGLVTISPSGVNVSSFEVFFADGTGESEVLALGQNAERMYAEGSYPVRVVATNLNGDTTELTKNLDVSFRAPENLVITVTESSVSNFGVSVSATADFETAFEVTFGEDPALAPVAFMEGDTVDYDYNGTGTYTITVTALSGGAATTETTEVVMIVDPVSLPLDFESTTLNYNLINFESAVSIIANPDISSGNDSASVVSIEKTGTQTFGGVVVPLSAPIDFSGPQNLRMKTWSPMPVGTKVTIKLENVDGSIASADYEAFTTVSSEWETLFFDTAGLDTTQPFSRFVVFFDLGAAPTGDVNYFDDIELAEGPPILLPLDFEDPNRIYNIGTNNGGFSIVANPVPDVVNSSSTVLQFDRNATGPNNFALVAIVVDQPVVFNSNTSFTLKVYSPRAGLPVWLKVERIGNGGLFQEVTSVTTTVANGWEELTFNSFTGNTTNDLRNIVIFFDPLQATSAPETIYIDDLIKIN